MTTLPFGLRLVLPLVVAAALATSCSSGDDSTAAPAADVSAPAAAPSAETSTEATTEPSAPAAAPSSAPAAEPVTITIQDFEYDVPDTVAPGAQITVMNEDSEAHTVTLEDGPSVVVQGGSSATMTAPADAGTYAVVCDFHGSMMAELVVA